MDISRRTALITGLAATASLAGGERLFAQQTDPAVVAAAKKEGRVSLYGGLITPTQQALKEAFEKKYPEITVDLLYLSGAPMMNRIMSETQAGRHLADVVAFDAQRYSVLLKNNLLANYTSSEAGHYDPSTFSKPPGYWIETHSYAVGIVYNNKMVSPQQAPTKFEDLLKPEWKDGKIAIVSFTSNELMIFFAAALVRDWGEAKAFDFFKALAAQKPLVFGPGGIRVSQGVANGEFPIGLGFVSHVFTMGGKDKTMSFAKTNPIYQTSGPGTGVMAKAPHPNAARLFADFINSAAAQDIIVASGYRSNYKGIKQPEGMQDVTVSGVPYPPPAELEAMRKRLESIFGA